MCLAVPAQILEIEDDRAVVDLQGNRVRVCTALTPEAIPGTWVLVHAGFAISTMEESAARETWDYLREAALANEAAEDAGESA
ncbi:MAG: HypC/HybG/HupF family hydrogenase formation chaperone [Phycisphaerae bacterium]|nr:HypC/HybG/HupF family hydrogenase formation chaperone [Phycisphaerae bacterium]